MDEVDGMHGSEASGGMNFLIQTIKTSKIPFICTCNERDMDKIKGLARVCYDIPLRNPHQIQIAARLLEIASLEGLSITKDAAETLADRSGCDIRGSINYLQSLDGLQGLFINASFIYEYMGEIEEDTLVQLNKYDALDRIFLGEKSNLTWEKRSKLVEFNWEDLADLAIENYEKAINEDESRNSSEKRSAKIRCENFAKEILIYKEAVYHPSYELEPFHGQYPHVLNRPLSSERDYSYVAHICRLVVALGAVVAAPIKFASKPKLPIIVTGIQRKHAMLMELNERLSPSRFLTRNMLQENHGNSSSNIIDDIIDYCNPTDDIEYLHLVLLPKLRDRLLEPLLMEEPDGAKKVAAELWNLNLEPRHLWVHMKLLQLRVQDLPTNEEFIEVNGDNHASQIESVLESFKKMHPDEDLYDLVTNEMKAKLIYEYKSLKAGYCKTKDPSIFENDGIKNKVIYLRKNNGSVKGQLKNDLTCESPRKTRKSGGKREEMKNAMNDLKKMTAEDVIVEDYNNDEGIVTSDG